MKRSLLSTASIFFSIITIIFAVLSIFQIDNWLYRIITQASLSLFMLLNGIHTFVYKKQKLSGYLLIGVSAFILFVMVHTIIIGFQIDAL